MESLTEIATRHRTDKATAHKYTDLYEILFRSIRNKPINLLEIGVQFAFSLKTWEEYFPFAKITGIDLVSNGLEFGKNGRIELIVGNAFTNEMVNSLNSSYDILIDDSSHSPQDQTFVVLNYSKLLSQEGLLIIEDIGSLETAEHLKGSVPEGFNWAIIDMRGVPDNILFLVFRK